jgi:non-ribosomal peptide synthetase component E (peptide arylation enzyme)
MICADGGIKFQHIAFVLVLHKVGQDLDDLFGMAETLVFHQRSLWSCHSVDSCVRRGLGIPRQEDAV